MDALVVLKHGPVVRALAVALACDLERRGHAMAAADGRLSVTNGSSLTAEDRAAITRDKAHLIACCEYRDSGACDV